MICAWKELLGILPLWMRQEVDTLGNKTLQELRLRLDMPVELITSQGSIVLRRKVCKADLDFVVNTASRYSPWTAGSCAFGYLTAPGGHRIGICGDSITDGEIITGIRSLRSLCIRVARDFEGISGNLAQIPGSMLILGPPGSGKTTLLRDLIRGISNTGSGSVSVIDERGELFPATASGYCFDIGKRTDVLTGANKSTGIDIVLRSMGPSVIAVDEITAEKDCLSLMRAAGCGVRLLATAHASGLADLRKRAIYRSLTESKIFTTVIILQMDKVWHLERIMV